MKRSALLGVMCGLLGCSAPMAAAVSRDDPEITLRLPNHERPGAALAVRVPDQPLVFTGQIVAPTAGADAKVEVAGALAELGEVLAQAGTSFGRLVRLTAYVADATAAAAVETAVAERFAEQPVACVVVRTPLVSARYVALEAVAARSRGATAPAIRDERAAVLPAGGKIFISGQAEKGTDVTSAVRLTMAGLHRSLAHVGLPKSAVVQVKAFIRPFSDHAAARREIVASFDGAVAPPILLIEWQSDLFAEIELIAAAPALAAKAGETVAHSWLPWLTPSPRYCHVAYVPAKVPLIFIGAIDGGAGDDRAQMKRIFEQLGSALYDVGSSYRHLVKATYYLGAGSARTALGDIRGVYFDPARPPAASALQVGAFARPGRSAEIEMIAVPVK